MAGRKRVRELTYRTEKVDPRYVYEMAERLIGGPVVVFMPNDEEHQWRRGYLVNINRAADKFRLTWTRDGKDGIMRGIWRVHNARLFTNRKFPEPTVLPEKPRTATVRKSTNKSPKEGAGMATRSKTAAKAKSTRSTSTRSTNGGLTEAQKRRIANDVAKRRAKKEPWPEILEDYEDDGYGDVVKVRKLLREFGHDEVIQERGSNIGPAQKKAAAKRRRATQVEDEEDVAPRRGRKPAPKKKVTVKRGRGRAVNPS